MQIPLNSSFPSIVRRHRDPWEDCLAVFILGTDSHVAPVCLSHIHTYMYTYIYIYIYIHTGICAQIVADMLRVI